MENRFYSTLTTIGAQKIAAAAASNKTLQITHMAVGDGGGSLPVPSQTQRKLINETHRAALNQMLVNPDNAEQIIAEMVIPSEIGGWWIREVGLFDADKDLIAIANCPETYKPLLAEGSGRAQIIRMLLAVSSTEAITFIVDPSLITVTKDYVDGAIEAHARSRSHPDGTLTDKGFVQLSSAVDSDSEELAATPRAVKAAKVAADSAANKLSTHEQNSNVHKIAAVEGLQGALDSKAPDGYGLGKSATTLLDFNALKIPSGFYAGAGGSDVSNLPAPYGCGVSIHRTGGSDSNGFQGQLLIDSDSSTWVRGSTRTVFSPWAKLYTTQNKPPIEAVVGLQTALDGKASASHTQAMSTITGLQAALDEKSPSVHYHSIGGVNGLQTALDGKAPFGYGLGTEARNMPDANAIGVGCGFYAGGGAGAQNFFDAYSPMLHVFRSGGGDNTGIITQMQATRGRLAFRTRESNTWFGWHELAQLTSTLGYSQTWKDVTPSRASGVNYTNSTGRPVQIFVSTVPSKNPCSAQITVGGVVVASMSLGGNQNLDYTRHTSVSAIIPVGAVYKVDASSIQLWSELS